MHSLAVERMKHQGAQSSAGARRWVMSIDPTADCTAGRREGSSEGLETRLDSLEKKKIVFVVLIVLWHPGCCIVGLVLCCDMPFAVS